MWLAWHEHCVRVWMPCGPGQWTMDTTLQKWRALAIFFSNLIGLQFWSAARRPIWIEWQRVKQIPNDADYFAAIAMNINFSKAISSCAHVAAHALDKVSNTFACLLFTLQRPISGAHCVPSVRWQPLSLQLSNKVYLVFYVSQNLINKMSYFRFVFIFAYTLLVLVSHGTVAEAGGCASTRETQRTHDAVNRYQPHTCVTRHAHSQDTEIATALQVSECTLHMQCNAQRACQSIRFRCSRKHANFFAFRFQNVQMKNTCVLCTLGWRTPRESAMGGKESNDGDGVRSDLQMTDANAYSFFGHSSSRTLEQ